MPLTVATAGHIDHGKTTLVEALTGKNTDRLPEEQARGISIDLGYAPLALADGTQLSIVDVPGHERFVRTMVAGATGVDLFLLVIDANEGARPQTLEHLAVLRLLGVERGVVALTKADLTDAETLELARAEAEELVPGAAVVAVSAKTGEGLDALRDALAEIATERERTDAPTRLYVDRSFTLRGIGTVVTGTLWSGSIGEGDELRVEPRGRTVRVRSVQVHDRPVDRAEAGQRVAVALPGVERGDVRRGDALVAPGAYRPTWRWRSLRTCRPGCTCTTGPPTCPRASRSPATATRSSGSPTRSWPRAGTVSSCERARPSAAASSSTRARPGTRASSEWRRSSAASRSCTRPSARTAGGSGRSNGSTSFVRILTVRSTPRIHSTPESRFPPRSGRRRSSRCSASNAAAPSSTVPEPPPSSAHERTRPPRSRPSSGSSR